MNGESVRADSILAAKAVASASTATNASIEAGDSMLVNGRAFTIAVEFPDRVRIASVESVNRLTGDPGHPYWILARTGFLSQ